MIITVTANPAYDVTYGLPAMTPGEVHRIASVHRRPGGKGVNVASVLTQLGEAVVATGFASEAFAEETEWLGIPADFVHALAQVRSTLAVVEDGRTTSLWEPGASLTDPAGSVAALLERVDRLLRDADCLVVSGSLPPGVDDRLPADLARLAHTRGVPAIVDTSGPSLAAAAAVPGVVLMPNADELAELCGPMSTPADVASAARSLVAAGARAVFATRGREGMVVVTDEGAWQVPAPVDVAGNPTGAGDSAAAAVARGLVAGLSAVEIARDAVALAATAVAAPVAGQVDLELFQELRSAIAAHALTVVPTRRSAPQGTS